MKIATLALIGLWPLALGLTSLLAAAQYATPRGHITFQDGSVVTVELAATEPVRQKGLMFRTSLAERAGMLFIFDEPGFYPFWMQNCVIALDILWVDTSGRIVSIAPSVPPCRKAGCDPPCAAPDCPTYPPRAGTIAKYVIEVPAGFASRHKVSVGQRVKMDFPR